ncbi:WG repeat-containing protein [Bacteroides sp. 224]|uniref:WG repeat-containing protein n=1 Tax=Bacteroides sp. 224 TaxID=2302936 RepID=UPI0013D0D62E|nr:WG repeat-containing protein [Bacteroides sp. 224]NDV65070.1 WG repeat-containing protein [Bacteroides sp. 224]
MKRAFTTIIRKTIILPTIVLLTACSGKSNSQEVVDEFISQFDGMNLDEAKEFLKKEYEGYQQLEALFNGGSFFGDETPKKYAKEDESYSEFPTFAKPEDIEKEYKEFSANAYILQEYKYPKTTIRVQVDEIEVEVSGNADYQANKIFFHDGSVDDKIQKFDSWGDLNTTKVIDSIQTTISYSYAEDYKQYEFTDEVNFNGGSIKVAKMQGNMAELIFTGKAKDYEKIIALNDEGKVLEFSSSSSGTKGAKEMSKVYAKAFKKLVNEADNFKTVDELKKAVRKAYSKLPSINDNEKSYTGFFKGNVSSFIVYMPTNTISKQINFTLVNKNPNIQKLIYAFDTNKKENCFLNQAGELVMYPNNEKFYPENDLYYYTETKNDEDDEDEDPVREIYFLDTDKEQLMKIPEIQSVKTVTNTCVSVEKDGKKALWNAEGKAVTPYIYNWIERIEGSEDIIRVFIDDKCGLINTKGETVLPVIYNQISDYTNGRALVERGEKLVMFIDEAGKQAIPLTQYLRVTEFSEGLAVVTDKNRKYGFINVNGEIVLPLIYDDARPFSHGITLVEYNGKYGLINREGTFIVPATSYGYSMTGMYKRKYYLDQSVYNEYGEFIEE